MRWREPRPSEPPRINTDATGRGGFALEAWMAEGTERIQVHVIPMVSRAAAVPQPQPAALMVTGWPR